MPRPPRPYSPDPLAYFLTWTTYGTWLPGDARGWTDRHGLPRGGEPALAASAARRMSEAVVSLSSAERHAVETTIGSHCEYRGWSLHAVACRTCHVHVVLTAPEVAAGRVLGELKAWCTKAIVRERACSGITGPRRTWTRGGSCRIVSDMRGLDSTVAYVREGQDAPRR